MSGDEDTFRPRLGRIGDQGRRPRFSAVSHIRAARRGTGGQGASRRPAGGRGSARQVMVKARVVRLSGKGLALQRAHLAYLQRDGAGKDAERGAFYDREQDGVEGSEFLERGRADRHHFRFIVSPEDGQQLGDLKPFVRALMGQMEADLDTRLDWVAMDHHDTDNPHTHILVRGAREDGSELRMDREYISRGIRQRASALLTRQLGLESVHELEARLELVTDAPRVTRMDRLLARRSGETGEVDLSGIRRHQKQYQARLIYLERHGLASDKGHGRWQVSPDLLRTLGRIERQDIALERTRRALLAAGIERPLARPFIGGQSRPTIGRVLASGFDEQSGKAWVIVDAVDGKAHHVGLNAASGLREGEIVRITPKRLEPLETRSLEAQVRAPGLTWLDTYLAGKDPAEILPAGFGAELRDAARQRLAELERRGLILGMDQPGRPGAATLEKLRWEDIHQEGRTRAAQTGRPYRPPVPGETISGELEEVISTPSGRFAVIGRAFSLEFSLVPWQADMERHLYRQVSMELSHSLSLSRMRERSLGLGL